ncbi:MAG: hypothetical protein OSA24_07100 [Longimicrobiales bacterium]|nr:hypothetical protein [Longimicrobiales bacterium]
MIILLLFISMVLGTLFFGWPAIVMLGFLYGLTVTQARLCVYSALSGAGSWMLLLVWRTFNGTFPTLLTILEQSVNIPGWLVICITLASSGLMGAAGANLGVGTQLILEKLSIRFSH